MGYKIYLNITCRNKMCYVFVNTKITQYKTSPTLQIDVFVIRNKKNSGKLFSKYELLFLDQANTSSDPCQILILQFHTLRASLPPLPSLSYFTLVNWNPSLTKLSSCSPSVPLFLSNDLQILIPYGSNTQPIKKLKF